MDDIFKEAVKTVIDYFVVISQLNEVVNSKNGAVKRDDFKDAAFWREKERELHSKLPTSANFISLQEKLKKKS